ncbi:MAG: histidinol-phosphatase HisJ family protein [candidate division Zixibacteria bacterium]|nr:histidinol-phosphatase HisJ family protein [candidate division Zixibacteria bacterium]
MSDSPEFDNITALPFAGVSDYHCHCDFSVDAVGSVEDYCRAALKRGLAEICFTTHYDTNYAVNYSDNYIRIDGKKKQIGPDSLAAYVAAVRAAHERFYPLGLSVKLGLEFGWHDVAEEAAALVRERYPFDYFLCGIHQLGNKCLWGHGDVQGAFDIYSPEQFFELYFHQVTKAARTGLFDSIAHLDYYKRKAVPYYGSGVATAHRPYLDELFTVLSETGTGIEINTAALRHGRDDYYPQMEMINAAKKAGVEVVRLGSDAHRPEEVGFDFEAATALVPSAITGCDD